MKRVLLFLALLLLAAFAQAFTFVQISDTHITGSGAHEDNLRAIIGEINAMSPPPAFVVCTGDMTETGRPPDIKKYQEITKVLKVPLYNVLG
ncbi:MAG TPA: metallophosphoesterase, partial [Armatimonadota bacterium]|nr:metallophosphoesterase [Armatimonadota bacterium]